jgi:hypothetical protein
MRGTTLIGITRSPARGTKPLAFPDRRFQRLLGSATVYLSL